VIGRSLSHYRILEPIGSGGMGVVYRARDERLQRDVAIKVLPADALGDADSRRRFHREALSLSRLNHPRIATIHDFDSQDGVDFLVMELVPGTTLAARLQEGRLTAGETVAIGMQIAEALEAAHEAGVVHRDLKPGNVLLTPRGDVKVLDFGLARRIRDVEASTATLTRDEVVGTVPYMAPETLGSGPGPDARVDLWALGVILYEIVTGCRPFQESDAVRLMASILQREPVRPRVLRRDMPKWLEAVILRCLEKDPAARYPSARALLEDLKQSHAPRRAFRIPPLRGMVVPALVVAAVIGGAAALADHGCQGPGDEGIRSLAVLPLENLSGNPEEDFFAAGMTEEITTAIAQIGALRVTSRTSAMQFRGSKLDVKSIARRLRVDGIVQGSIRRTAKVIRISAQLVDADRDQYLWANNFERSPGDVLTLQNDIALAIAKQIQVRVTPGERSRLDVRRTVNPEAYEAYLRGRYYVSQQYSLPNLRRAMGEFRRAIDLDPGFALGYAGLAQVYALLGNLMMPSAEAMPKARAAARRALEIDSTLAQAHAQLAYVRSFFDWEWVEGGLAFQKALQLNPSDPDAHRDYGYYLTVRGRFDEAIAELALAADIDPLSTTISIYQLFPLYESKRYADVVGAATRILESDSAATHARFIRAQAYLAQGNENLAQSEIERCLGESPHPFYRAFLGVALARTGRADQARAILREMEGGYPENGAQPYGVAVLCLGVGDRDAALRWLERSVETRTEESAFLGVDPIMDPLRSDPRYKDLLRRVGLM